ncbi:MAG: hypothetical protein GYA50_09020 [Eubacteriaceae bacterium]|nr:hypothetical protein [Eubacteriaceae bacterium]
MNILQDLDNVLFIAKENGEYLVKDIPDKPLNMDLEINNIIEKYQCLSWEEKHFINNNISINLAWNLLSYSYKMAIYSLRSAEEMYFINGLVALSMTYQILDGRELLRVLTLFYDVSNKHKFTFDKMLKHNGSFTEFLINFLKRPEEAKTIECMGFIITKDKNNNIIYKNIL